VKDIGPPLVNALDNALKNFESAIYYYFFPISCHVAPQIRKRKPENLHLKLVFWWALILQDLSNVS